MLGYQRKSGTQQLLGGGTGDIGAVEHDRSGRRCEQPGYRSEHGRLACAIRADQPDDFTLGNGQRRVAKRGYRAVFGCQPRDLEHLASVEKEDG